MTRYGVMGACALWAVGCVALPLEEPAARDDEQDGAVTELLELDGGAMRPPTGEPYRGPTCPGAGAGGSGGSGGTQAFDAGSAEMLVSGDGTSPDGASSGADAAVGSVTEPPEPMASAPAALGAVVITELMIDPQALRDDLGEWIELWNPGAEPLDLSSCVLDDGSTTQRALTGLTLAPDALATIARSEQVGFTPDLLLAFSLTNSADTVAILCNGVEIDRVRYASGYPLTAGASLSLDPNALDATANDAASAWCASTAAYGAEHGTPGEANPPCHPDEEAAPSGDAGLP